MRTRLRPVWLLVAAVVLLVSGCGNSADPDTWDEAEQDDRFVDEEFGAKSAVEHNFLVSCMEANTANLTEAEARVLCGCSFDGLRQSLTLAEFQSLDKAPSPNCRSSSPSTITSWSRRTCGSSSCRRPREPGGLAWCRRR